ncbi:MAG: hypothetical protein ACTSVC_14375 [Promethearchaeota archaeon]
MENNQNYRMKNEVGIKSKYIAFLKPSIIILIVIILYYLMPILLKLNPADILIIPPLEILGIYLFLEAILYYIYFNNDILGDNNLKFKIKRQTMLIIKYIILLALLSCLILTKDKNDFYITPWSQVSFIYYVRSGLSVLNLFLIGNELITMLFHGKEIKNENLVRIGLSPIISLLFYFIIVAPLPYLRHIGLFNSYYLLPYIIIAFELVFINITFNLNAKKNVPQINDDKIDNKRENNDDVYVILHSNRYLIFFVLLLVISSIISVSAEIKLIKYLYPGDRWQVLRCVEVFRRADPTYTIYHNVFYPIFYGYSQFVLKLFIGLGVVNAAVIVQFINPIQYIALYLYFKELYGDINKKYAIYSMLMFFVLSNLLFYTYIFGIDNLYYYSTQNYHLLSEFSFRTIYYLGFLWFFYSLKQSIQYFNNNNFNRGKIYLFLAILSIYLGFIDHFIDVIVTLPLFLIYLILFLKPQLYLRVLKLATLYLFILMVILNLISRNFYIYFLFTNMYLNNLLPLDFLKLNSYPSVLSQVMVYTLIFEGTLILLYVVLYIIGQRFNDKLVKLVEDNKNRLKRLLEKRGDSLNAIRQIAVIILASIYIIFVVIMLRTMCQGAQLYWDFIFNNAAPIYSLPLQYTIIFFISIFSILFVRKKDTYWSYIVLLFLIIFGSITWSSRIWNWFPFFVIPLGLIALKYFIVYVYNKKNIDIESKIMLLLLVLNVPSLLTTTFYRQNYTTPHITEDLARILNYADNNLEYNTSILVDGDYIQWASIDRLSQAYPIYKWKLYTPNMTLIDLKNKLVHNNISYFIYINTTKKDSVSQYFDNLLMQLNVTIIIDGTEKLVKINRLKN